MATRITYVLEYESDNHVPHIGPFTKDLGRFTKVVAVQFSDALAELEVALEDASEETKERAYRAAVSIKSVQP